MIGGSVALSITAARNGVIRTLFQFTLVSAVLTTAAMVAMLGGTIFCSLAARASAPTIFNGSVDYLGLSVTYAGTLLTIMAMMAVAIGVAVISVVRWIRTLRSAQKVLRNFGARFSKAAC